MTRPVLRRRVRPRPRSLNYTQRLIIAKAIVAGRPMKQLAHEWRVSRSRVNLIFHEFLEYRMVWKEIKSEENEADSEATRVTSQSARRGERAVPEVWLPQQGPQDLAGSAPR